METDIIDDEMSIEGKLECFMCYIVRLHFSRQSIYPLASNYAKLTYFLLFWDSATVSRRFYRKSHLGLPAETISNLSVGNIFYSYNQGSPMGWNEPGSPVPGWDRDRDEFSEIPGIRDGTGIGPRCARISRPSRNYPGFISNSKQL